MYIICTCIFYKILQNSIFSTCLHIKSVHVVMFTYIEAFNSEMIKRYPSTQRETQTFCKQAKIRIYFSWIRTCTVRGSV